MPQSSSADDTPASAEELGAWDAQGTTRVWGYSANGGASEQGRLEFCSAGRLKTSWGPGTWHIDQNSGFMDISWNGTTDTIALDPSGLGFELVYRNGRPAQVFKHKTCGRAVPG